tara:strand:- start:1513 stop:2022 length:510 start_codon:yes stop_codon:yes gene_type:complete
MIRKRHRVDVYIHEGKEGEITTPYANVIKIIAIPIILVILISGLAVGFGFIDAKTYSKIIPWITVEDKYVAPTQSDAEITHRKFFDTVQIGMTAREVLPLKSSKGMIIRIPTAGSTTETITGYQSDGWYLEIDYDGEYAVRTDDSTHIITENKVVRVKLYHDSELMRAK